MLDTDERQIYPIDPPPPAPFPASRDAFVASTAVKLDHLQAALARLEKDADDVRTLISNLAETVEQNHRYYSFQQNEKRYKELRVEELLRSFRDLKSRMDRIEGVDRPAVNYSQTTFESVNARINEIAGNQTRLENATLTLSRNALLLLSGVFAALVMFGLRLI